VLYYNILRF